MSKVKKTSLQHIQDAWIRLLLDFRSWYIPESKLMDGWKMRPIGEAIRACRSNMVDDAENMLNAYRKNNNQPSNKPGDSAYIPVMLTATALMDQPPTSSVIANVPYPIDVEINGTRCKMRMRNVAVRAQITFFATNPDDARSVCEQFCSYMIDDTRRKFNVRFELLDGFYDTFPAFVNENELFPNPIPLDQTNLSVIAVDAIIVCAVPQVISGANYTDHGYDENGIPLQGESNTDLIIQADAYIDNDDKSDIEHDRVKVDPNTLERSKEFFIKE